MKTIFGIGMAIQLLTTFYINGTQNTMVVVAANKKTQQN
jgi:hypothetical protein